jgi:MOSC domain-containing protein YiiM
MSVLSEGSVEAGDRIEIVKRGDGSIPVRELFKAFFQPRSEQSAHILEQALAVPELSSEWRQKIERRLKHSDL